MLGGRVQNSALRKYYIKGGLLPGIATARHFTFFFFLPGEEEESAINFNC